MLKKSFSLFLVFLLLSSNFSLITSANSEEGVSDTSDGDWNVVWEDNFEGNELDLNKWSYDIGNGFTDNNGTYISGWGNEELQSYQEDNIRVENGQLILEGREETVFDEHGTYNYTSGKIHTKGKFSQRYGKFEAKIALPEGQGYWPAFWMMPEDDVYGGWAASGEIDIMENSGGTPNKVGGAIHYGSQWPNNTYTAKDYHFPEGQDVTDFNVYSVEWEPGEIRWYVNGELFQTLNNWSATSAGNPAPFAYPAPFDQEFYLILNLAIGGWYGGGPDETTELPGEMLVDYVKVYELTGRNYREPVEPVFEAEELPADAKMAIDGNYVYDPNFEQGFTTISSSSDLENNWNADYWNLVYMPDFNGLASATVDTLDGNQFAKVEIAQGGNQSYSVQLIQNVTLGKGRWYRLSFDAKSTAERNLNVKLGGGPDRGYTAYSPNRDFSLTNEVQSYELAFQMQHDTDRASRLEFNMGLNTNPVWIGNVKVEEIDALDPYNADAPKNPLSNGNHVYNGTFDLGSMDRMTYWNFNVEGADAKASVDSESRELEVAITDGGTSSDAITLVQKGMNLLANDEYKVTFEGRAAEARDVQVALVSRDGTVNYSLTETFPLTTAMEEKEMTFTMPNITDVEGQLVFYFGGNTNGVVIDNISMVRLSNNNDALNFDQKFPLKNGSFSNGFTNWDMHIQGEHEPGTSTAKIEVVDEVVKASIENEGFEPWHVLLMQNGMELLSNNTYVLEFDARSTVDRKLEVVLENATYNRYFSNVIELSNTMETYRFEFEMSTDDTVDLKYLLGKVANSVAVGSHDVYIDNVQLEVKGEREKLFPLVNGNFASGLESWNQHYQGAYDGPSQATFTEEAEEAKITVVHEGENPWDISLSQEEMNLEQGQTYVLEFDARTTIDRPLELVVDNGAPSYHRYFEEVIDLTGTMQTFSYEFVMPETDSVGLKFLVGRVAGVPIDNTHDIFIDNVKLEVKGAREALDGVPQEPETEPEEPTPPSEKKWREVGKNLVVDGSFERTTEFGNEENPHNWNVHNQGQHESWAGLAEFNVVDEAVNVAIQQVGWDWWHIQLYQDGIEVPSGTYKVEFEMSSELERTINLELTGSGAPIQTFEVGTELETFESIMEVSADGTYKLLFGLGKSPSDAELEVPYTVVIDNVKLIAVEEVVDKKDKDKDKEKEKKKEKKVKDKQ
ncbi:carbohydrate binding domain-containing protein [Sutcliffiella deserti]|uniref:carbohydrate binding domain-containing protein n=1 Tax=Sutcliffiella deserti TaxID=2875501 RepID=UPI001CC0166A|nr:carbohydrate binding domain-containing protein [Sutcliffiella deserti]